MIDEKIELIPAVSPGGFLDFLPETYIARQRMLRTIEESFTSFGFDGIETPMIEFERTLGCEAGDTGKQIFRIQSSSEDSENLAMRFDHTVPFARLIAQNPYNAVAKSGIELPWRRMVVGPVFRGERQQSGRYRQFYQFDADIAGVSSMVADTEIVAMMYRTMVKLGVERFVIRLNNRKILNGLAELVGLQGDAVTQKMMQTLDKIDKIGADAVMDELTQQLNLSSDACDKVRAFLAITGTNEEKLVACRSVFDGVAIAQKGIDELSEILALLDAFGIIDNAVSIDFSIARGLDYYTGPVMETVLSDAPQFGSVLSGGRYDGLVKRFTGQDLPSVGASIGVDRLFAALESLKVLDTSQKTLTDVVVLRIMPDADAIYMRIADQIRLTGKNVAVSLLSDTTFKQQFNYALRFGARFVVICGEDEMKDNVVKIKNLETREQVDVSMDDLAAYFAE